MWRQRGTQLVMVRRSRVFTSIIRTKSTETVVYRFMGVRSVTERDPESNGRFRKLIDYRFLVKIGLPDTQILSYLRGLSSFSLLILLL